MLQFRSRRALALAAIAFVTTAAAPAAPRSPGFTFDVESSTLSQNPMGPPVNVKISGRGMVSNKGIMRLDITGLEGNNPTFGVGDYFLTQEGKMMIVRPASKTYIDLSEMASSAMNLPAAVAAQMTISNVAGQTEKLTDGAPIEGRPTDHYKTTLSYSMNLMGQSLPATIVSDYWAAKLPVKFVNPLVGGEKTPVTTGPMVELINKQIELMPKIADAVIVKSTSSTTVNFMGQSMTTAVSSEMKNIKEGDVDESKFVLPEGFTKAAKP